MTHHKKLSKKRRLSLTRRVSLALQLVVALIPLLASPFIPEVQDIDSRIIITVSVSLAAISLVGFVLAWLIEPKTTSRTRSHASRG